ncbi:response regulator transcription factor [Aliiruegeria lutimaris]|uniref:Transcriptional regulatory protein, C terminal n=1 Tax=Aliiruegeria lutimaris TaxID=571298 RepID=A0A1G8QR75_9RHOB|nr:response regulator transcription factor [Aliiruegeria lutimaris]SDJ07224.1 Transcriptional regulatory protein, C terminal [Aliiruegeria lutimaris]
MSKATPSWKTHIVVVDDEKAVRQTLRDCLEAGGFRVTEARGREELFDVLSRDPANLITLDLWLGKDDGIDVAREIRTRWDVPIIMVTAKRDMIDRVVGLEIGADDYVTKPFHVRELLARIRSVLRRSQHDHTGPFIPADGPSRISFDDWVLDCRRRSVLSPAGKSGTLTAAEFELLRLLLLNPNRVLSRNEIMDKLKGPGWIANDRVIDNQIRRLRHKLESMNGEIDMIQSIRGSGYMLSANVAEEA